MYHLHAHRNFASKMKHNFLLFAVLIMIGTTHAKSDEMKTNSSKTLRLIYPQWQGGVVANWMPDIPANDVSRGYFLGAQLLQILAPESKQQTVEVPVSLDIDSHKEEKGISGYRAIIKQSEDALDLIRRENPDRIVTLGGECSVSVVPFTYLAEKYPDDVAVVWIDAHPDLNLPGDSYTGYHAMALTACFGMGDKKITDIFPAKLNPANSILVGLRAWDDTNASKERQEQIGVKSLSPARVAQDSIVVLNWLKTTGKSKVVIHFDLDALDPAEIIAAVGTDPDGLKIETVVRMINDIAKEYDVVGLTIAEPMPRVAIKIKNMLNQMPLLKE